MKSKLFNVLMIVALLSSIIAVLPASAYVPTEDVQVAEEAAPAVAKLPPVAIGAMRQYGDHLRPPAKDPALILKDEGTIPLDASPAQIQAARAEYLRRFAKQSQTWTSPKFQQWVLQREAQMTAQTRSPAAIQPVTATVFAMAVDFGQAEVFTLPMNEGYDDDGNPICVTRTVTVPALLKGQVPPPPATDNFSIWYSPTQTSDMAFYKSLIFGYEGPDRARYDLTDPDDGQPGINLEKRTVQEYYDNVAGLGNVYITGTVEGWVTVPHSQGRYGADQCAAGTPYGGVGVPPGQIAVDALEVFSATHPSYWTDPNFWPKYDGNGDGVLDTFWVIFAGVGQESGDDASPVGTFALWSHSSDLRSYNQWANTGYQVYEGDPATDADDIYVGPYTVQPEHTDVGVICEEFGHNFFGFPDLYSTDYNNSVGDWTIMSGGAWMGWLGGTAPATMPLWFKMIAAFETGGVITPVNWHEPMVTRAHDDPPGDVTIGQLEMTPPGVNKGVRVNLPSYQETTENEAGTGKAAYSGAGRDQVDLRIERDVAIPAGASGVLTMATYYEIEEDWDYGYVMVNDTTIADMDSHTTNSNPNGNNLGNGLTGAWAGVLRFDLSSYAGQTVKLTLRYKTDAAVTEPGLWIDDVTLDGTLLADFEDATAPGTFAGWSNTDPGWFVTPVTSSYNRYYLVEWRTKTKYDKMLKTAYIHNASSPETGDIVERVPYNIPAAVLYYRDTKYSSTYAIAPNQYDPPSYGPKYQLLVVDMNWQAMKIMTDTTPSTYQGSWSGRISSRDAGLTLQDTPGITISGYYGLPGQGPWIYPTQAAVTRFNDVNGYYSGFYYGPPCRAGYLCVLNRYDSAVIPAKGPYSTRITDFAGEPLYEWYGTAFPPSWLGSGNPGDDGVQFGAQIELKSKAGDDAYNSTAVLGFGGVNLDLVSTVDPVETQVKAPGVYTFTYQTVIANTGTEIANNVAVTYTLDPALTLVSQTSSAGTLMLVPGSTYKWTAAQMYPGERYTLTVVATRAVDLPLDDIDVNTFVTSYDGQITRGPVLLWSGIEAPAIAIDSPTNDAVFNTITTATVPIEVTISDWFNVPTDGHWNLWVDGTMTGSVMTYTTSTDLPLGTHVISAELRSPADVALGPTAAATIVVEPRKLFLPVVMKNS